jgi:hypothetical protein
MKLRKRYLRHLGRNQGSDSIFARVKLTLKSTENLHELTKEEFFSINRIKLCLDKDPTGTS